MTEITPIGLHYPEESKQQHAPFTPGDKIPAIYLDVTEWLSEDADNALHSVEGKLYAKDCCHNDNHSDDGDNSNGNPDAGDGSDGSSGSSGSDGSSGGSSGGGSDGSSDGSGSDDGSGGSSGDTDGSSDGGAGIGGGDCQAPESCCPDVLSQWGVYGGWYGHPWFDGKTFATAEEALIAVQNHQDNQDAYLHDERRDTCGRAVSYGLRDVNGVYTSRSVVYTCEEKDLSNPEREDGYFEHLFADEPPPQFKETSAEGCAVCAVLRKSETLNSEEQQQYQAQGYKYRGLYSKHQYACAADNHWENKS